MGVGANPVGCTLAPHLTSPEGANRMAVWTAIQSGALSLRLNRTYRTYMTYFFFEVAPSLPCHTVPYFTN